MAVDFTLVQTEKKIYINETIQKHSKYKDTYYQNTHTLQNKLKQPQYKLKQTLYKIYPNETVTI